LQLLLGQEMMTEIQGRMKSHLGLEMKSVLRVNRFERLGQKFHLVGE
jgi:hypothetical protein